MALGQQENADPPVTVDLSVSETKPLTSYGSGEDEEEGSDDEYLYTETDVPTSMQHEQDVEQSERNEEKIVKNEESEKQKEVAEDIDASHEENNQILDVE